jgi:hypothetical protein
MRLAARLEVAARDVAMWCMIYHLIYRNAGMHHTLRK